MNPRKLISAKVRLRTVVLYEELRSSKQVALKLSEETGVPITYGAVNSRLFGLGISSNSLPEDFRRIIDSLEREVEAEAATPNDLPVRSSESDNLPELEKKEQDIETLLAFVKMNSYSATGKVLGIDGRTVKDRLIKILGEGKTHPAAARKKLKKWGVDYK
jgi:hypothetical protein